MGRDPTHKGTKTQNTQHRYSHAPTDIVTIINPTMVNKGHIYTIQSVGIGARYAQGKFKRDP